MPLNWYHDLWDAFNNPSMILVGFWFPRFLLFQTPEICTKAVFLFFLEIWERLICPQSRDLMYSTSFSRNYCVIWESTPFHPSAPTQEDSVVYQTDFVILLQKLLFVCLCIFPYGIFIWQRKEQFSTLSFFSFLSLSLVLTLLNIFATRRYFWSEYTAMTLCFQWQRSVLAAISRHKMPCKTASWFSKKSDYIMLYHSCWLKFQESSNRDFVLPALNSKHVLNSAQD